MRLVVFGSVPYEEVGIISQLLLCSNYSGDIQGFFQYILHTECPTSQPRIVFYNRLWYIQCAACTE